MELYICNNKFIGCKKVYTMRNLTITDYKDADYRHPWEIGKVVSGTTRVWEVDSAYEIAMELSVDSVSDEYTITPDSNEWITHITFQTYWYDITFKILSESKSFYRKLTKDELDFKEACRTRS